MQYGHAITLCASHETSWDSAMIFKRKSNELLKNYFAVKLLDKELALVLSQSFNTILCAHCSLLHSKISFVCNHRLYFCSGFGVMCQHLWERCIGPLVYVVL